MAKLDLLAIIDDYVFGHVLRTGELQARAADAHPVAQAIIGPGQHDQRFEHGLQALVNSAAAGTSPPRLLT